MLFKSAQSQSRGRLPKYCSKSDVCKATTKHALFCVNKPFRIGHFVYTLEASPVHLLFPSLISIERQRRATYLLRAACNFLSQVTSRISISLFSTHAEHGASGANLLDLHLQLFLTYATGLQSNHGLNVFHGCFQCMQLLTHWPRYLITPYSKRIHTVSCHIFRYPSLPEIPQSLSLYSPV